MKIRFLVLFAALFSACLDKVGHTNAPFLIINMSLPRTGTTSFAGIYEQYRSTHEFMISETINTLIDYREGKISGAQLKHFLKDRNQRAGHQVDSASFFFLAPEAVFDAFPEAKFFLAVRACENWIISMVDNSVFAHKMIREGKTTVDLTFLPRYSEIFIKNHSDAAFQDLNRLRKDAAHIVRELGSFWENTSFFLLESMLKLPRERRLIIRLEDFNKSTDRFARLAGIPVGGLQLNNRHLNRDRDTEFYRKLLGGKVLTDSCSPGQQKIDAWFRVHAAELN